MTSIQEIVCSKDLRSIIYSDLFYEVFDSSDKQSKADAIAKKLEPSLAAPATPNENLERLLDLRKALKKARKDRKRWELRIDEGLLDDFEEAMENIKRNSHKHFIAMRLAISWVEKDGVFNFAEYVEKFSEMFKQARENGDVTEVDYSSIVDDLLEPDDREDFDSLVDDVVYAKPVFKKTIEETDSRLDGYTHVSPDETFSGLPKHVKALLLITKQENDQDMIVFFGNNFHKAFEDVNAYTGLLYTYEYFEYEGML